MLFRIDFDISIYPDRVQVTDRRSGRFIDFAAEVPFSAPGRLVANAIYFENALAKAVRKAMSGGFILLDAKVNITTGTAQLSEQERQAVRGVLRDIGFKTIAFGGEVDSAPIEDLPPGIASLL